jgi:hypothetical protein
VPLDFFYFVSSANELSFCLLAPAWMRRTCLCCVSPLPQCTASAANYQLRMGHSASLNGDCEQKKLGACINVVWRRRGVFGKQGRGKQWC